MKREKLGGGWFVVENFDGFERVTFVKNCFSRLHYVRVWKGLSDSDAYGNTPLSAYREAKRKFNTEQYPYHCPLDDELLYTKDFDHALKMNESRRKRLGNQL